MVLTGFMRKTEVTFISLFEDKIFCRVLIIDNKEGNYECNYNK